MASDEQNSKTNPVKVSLNSDDILSLLPAEVNGMITLDKELFNIMVELPSITCEAKLCGDIQKQFKRSLLNRPKFSNIVIDQESKLNRIVLFNPSVVKDINSLTAGETAFIEKAKCTFHFHKVSFKYANFSFDELMSVIIPNNTKDRVTSFETVGHIAHFNLKPNLLKYKTVIGEILLDKNQHIKTVVNKIDSIDETFRFFKMELLAGEDNMLAKVQEHGCVFQFDYSKVYWNSRLQTEHQRITNLFNEGDIIFDVFAGVGPFAIPAAKKKCIVHANDLNENSYKALKENGILNKIKDGNLYTYNMDGRDFLNDVVIEKFLCESHKEHSVPPVKKHIIMNLPAIASQFLDVFRSKYDVYSLPLEVCKDFMIHCYVFSSSKTPKVDAELTIGSAIGVDITPHASTHFVRRVAPNKVMMCTSFRLSWFEGSADQCACYTSTSAVSRKRVLEGGEDPMLFDIDKKKNRLF